MWRTVGGSGLGCFSWLICGGRWNPQSFHWNCCRSKRLLEVKHLELLTLLIIQYISWSILNCMNNLKIIFLYDNSKNILQIYTSSLHINASDHATFAKHCVISYYLWGHRPRSKRAMCNKGSIGPSNPQNTWVSGCLMKNFQNTNPQASLICLLLFTARDWYKYIFATLLGHILGHRIAIFILKTMQTSGPQCLDLTSTGFTSTFHDCCAIDIL